jgi:gamma-glutamyltranspeptidase / glutathione hydrolase
VQEHEIAEKIEKQGERFMAVTPHSEAAAAAEKVLRDGGNAIDAAVASMLTLCVVTPAAVGLGGYGGSMVIYVAREKKVTAIDFTAPAPLAYDEKHYAADPVGLADRGPLAVTVPAILAGLDAALQRYGTRSWRDLTTHAHALAEDGFPLHRSLHEGLTRWLQVADRVSARAILNDRELPEPGQPFVQKDLAKFIRLIAEQGAAAMYQGEVPKMIARQIQQAGGILSEEDFHSYQPVESEPLAIDYRSHRLFTPPPPSAGITTLSILKTLEQFDVSGLPRWGSEYLHVLLEATKLCWRERQAWLGDPRMVQFPMEQMLSERSAAERAKRIVASEFPPAAPLPPAPTHTANVLTADGEGNVVSLTATHGIGFGAYVAIDGLGLFINHGMSRFTFTPGSPNAPAAGKRMQHNMAPVLVMEGDRPRHAIGMPGATRIVTVTAQLGANLVDYRTTPGQALRAPRVHVETDEPIAVTPSLPAETVEELAAKGHQISQVGGIGGPANVMSIEAGGRFRGGTASGANCIATG